MLKKYGHNFKAGPEGDFYKGFLDSGLTHGKSVKVFGSGTQLIVTGKYSLNSVVR